MVPFCLGVVSAVVAWAAIDSGPERRSDRSESPWRYVLIGVGAVAMVLGASQIVLVPVVCTVAAGIGWGVVRYESSRRAELRRLQQQPVVVAVLARRVAMGLTVKAGLESLTEDQLRVVSMTGVRARILSGERAVDALASERGLVSAALLATEICGGTTAAALERLADRLSFLALDGRAAQSQSGQQLASAVVMSTLAPLASILYGLNDQSAADFYLRTPLGAAVIGVSLLLSGAGWFWMRFITRPRSL
jgi:Flp pilus assembly protein TadB